MKEVTFLETMARRIHGKSSGADDGNDKARVKDEPLSSPFGTTDTSDPGRCYFDDLPEQEQIIEIDKDLKGGGEKGEV